MLSQDVTIKIDIKRGAKSGQQKDKYNNNENGLSLYQKIGRKVDRAAEKFKGKRVTKSNH